MTTIVTRAGKGSTLTANEVDANFTNLNTAKTEVTSLSASSGSTLIGHLPTGTGAVATTVASAINTTLQYPTGQFYQDLGARVHRFYDRILVAGAAVNDGQAWNGTTHGNQDYVSTNVPQGPTTAAAQFASLSLSGGMGALVGTRSSDGGGSGTQSTLGIAAFGINDYTTTPVITQAGYFEAQRKASAGITFAVEIDCVNQGAAVAMTPYSSLASVASGYTVNLALAAGGGRTGTAATSAGLLFNANGNVFTRGIVVLSGSITSGEFLSLPTSHFIQWYTTGAQPIGSINNVATGTNQFGIEIQNSGVMLGKAPSTNSGINSAGGLLVGSVATGVNYVTVTGAATGTAPAIATNAGNLAISSATGAVQIGNTTANPTLQLTTAQAQILPTVATPAGGTTGSGLTLGSTTNLGIFFGSGAPTLSAAQGSLYIRTDGSSTSTRMYINTNGTTGWTNVVTAA